MAKLMTAQTYMFIWRNYYGCSHNAVKKDPLIS